MPNPAAVALIAERLPNGLMHPGDGKDQPAKLIPLPGLSSTGIPPEQAAHFAKAAGLPPSDVPQLIAEAIVSLLETDGGLELIPRTELQQLRAEAATLDQVNPSAPMVNVHCRCDHTQPLLTLAVGRPMVITSGQALRKRLDDVCGCS